VEEALAEARRVISKIEAEYRVSVRLEVLQRVESRPTAKDAPVVTLLSRAIFEALGVRARPVGIGGGTVGAFLRNNGIDAAVWSKLDDTAHQPNEYALVENILDGARVMALLALGS
jgi:succinyl-diaminopimelate desuccinylase